MRCAYKVGRVSAWCRQLANEFDRHQQERFERFKRSKLKIPNMKKVLALKQLYVAALHAPVFRHVETPLFSLGRDYTGTPHILILLNILVCSWSRPPTCVIVDFRWWMRWPADRAP